MIQLAGLSGWIGGAVGAIIGLVLVHALAADARLRAPGAALRSALFLALTLPAFALSIVSRTPMGTHTSPLAPLAVIPAALAVVVGPGIQLAAAVAGRGRAAPLGRAIDLVTRGLAALFAILGVVATVPSGAPLDVAAKVALAATYAAAGFGLAARLGPRLGAGGLLVPAVLATLGVTIGPDLWRASFSLTNGAYFPVLGLPALLGLGLFAMRKARIDARALEILGIRIAAPADLALQPMALSLAAIALIEGGSSRTAGELPVEVMLIAIPLAALVAFALALRYVRRRIDEAEAAAAARS